MIYRIIASGSSGNALAICEGSLNLIIDCGVSYKKIKSLKPDFLLLTHEHSDHMRIRTIKAVLDNHPLCKIVIGPHLFQKLRDAGIPARRIVIADSGNTVELSKGKTTIQAETFPLIHDVPNVGWKLSIDNGKLAMMYATDTASIDHVELKNLDYYFIEANYEDEELERRMGEKLQRGEYSYEVRVRDSHLSKAQTDKWLSDNAGENSKFIYMHQHEERS